MSIPILYKYFPPERISFFENRLVRFTQPSRFNDPFEFLPYEEFVPDVTVDDFDNFIYQKATDCTISEEIQRERLRNIKMEFAAELQEFMVGTYDNLGVFCLSEEWDNILMWSHYASNHKGFVIGFNTEHPFFKNYEFELKSIDYSNKRPSSSVKDDYIKNLIYTKADVWRYEKEWRICRDLLQADKVIDQDVYLFEIPIDAIVCVYLGAKMSEEDKRNVTSETISWQSIPSAYQVHMHSRSYQLTPTPLDM